MANMDSLSNAMYTQFKSDVYTLAQQKMSIFLPLVDMVQVGGKPGERVVFPRIGKGTVAEEVTDRYQELEANAAPFSARSLILKQYHTHYTIDEIDDMRMIVDPTAPFVQAMSMSLARKIDEVIYGALIGSADDKTGGTSTAFDTANQEYDAGVAVDAVDLIAVRRKFNDAFVMPGENVAAVMEGVAYTDLLQDQKITNAFYIDQKPLPNGVLGRFLDFDFTYWQNMPLYDSTPTYQTLFFTRKGLKVAMPKAITVSIDRVPERRNAILMQATFTMGAVRMEENQVVRMKYTG